MQWTTQREGSSDTNYRETIDRYPFKSPRQPPALSKPPMDIAVQDNCFCHGQVNKELHKRGLSSTRMNNAQKGQIYRSDGKGRCVEIPTKTSWGTHIISTLLKWVGYNITSAWKARLLGALPVRNHLQEEMSTRMIKFFLAVSIFVRKGL